MTLNTKWWRAAVSWPWMFMCLCTNMHQFPCLPKEAEQFRSMHRWKKREGKREKLNMGGWDNVIGGRVREKGGWWPVCRRRDREKGEHRGMSQGALVWAGACSGPLQAAAQNRALGSLFFSPPPLSEKRERFHRGNFTAGYKAVRGRGSSPEMNRGGSLRRRLSSLRGAWRWSTGYLFRKVGDGCMVGWM